MTGKEKLIEWIKGASIDDVAEFVNNGGCCKDIGLFNPGDCRKMIDFDCDDCIKQALEKEYPDE